MSLDQPAEIPVKLARPAVWTNSLVSGRTNPPFGTKSNPLLARQADHPTPIRPPLAPELAPESAWTRVVQLGCRDGVLVGGREPDIEHLERAWTCRLLLTGYRQSKWLGVQDHDFGAARSRRVYHVLRAAGSITSFTVPERDQGDPARSID
jgi:hypothetical protein